VEGSCTPVRTVSFRSCFQGCETWFLTLRDHRLRLLDGEMKGKCVGIRAIVTGRWENKTNSDRKMGE
jgi:hypothetical protein